MNRRKYRIESDIERAFQNFDRHKQPHELIEALASIMDYSVHCQGHAQLYHEHLRRIMNERERKISVKI